MSETEEKKLRLVEEREKDLLAKQAQFEERMKETQDRFARDRSNYEQNYNQKLAQLEEQEKSIKEREQAIQNEKDRFNLYQKE